MHSIKTKLVLAISVLVIFLFSITALLLIDEKRKELSQDIYTKARATAELTAPKIVDLYQSYLAEKSFVIFNREIKDIFSKDEDIFYVKLHTFAGETVYDSSAEKDRAYEGEMRQVLDPDLLPRVKANLPSFLLETGRTVYLKKDAEGVYLAVNVNEKEIPAIQDTDVIKNIVYPLAGKFAVEFGVTYDNLKQRVFKTTERIVFLLIFGILLGLGFGFYFATRITGPIAKLKEGALVLAKGDFKVRVNVKTRDEVGLLADTFNKMAEGLEASTKAMIYKERMAKELEVAARIQKEILPTVIPQVPGLDIAAMLVPAAEIGGDCYDFIKLAPDNFLFYISDVMGHGVPSGIVVSIANALIYSYSGSSNLADILISANKVLKAKTSSNMFVTLLMARYRNGKMEYVSAGHPEMLHYHSFDKKVSQEKGGGVALGMMPDVSKMVSSYEVQFPKGDCIVLYSDGITEAANTRGEQYGPQRLKRALSEHGDLTSAEAIKNALVADVKEFMEGAEQSDDITLIVVKRV